jgi:nitrogen-specific signal transduction histidine kinase
MQPGTLIEPHHIWPVSLLLPQHSACRILEQSCALVWQLFQVQHVVAAVVQQQDCYAVAVPECHPDVLAQLVQRALHQGQWLSDIPHDAAGCCVLLPLVLTDRQGFLALWLRDMVTLKAEDRIALKWMAESLGQQLSAEHWFRIDAGVLSGELALWDQLAESRFFLDQHGYTKQVLPSETAQPYEQPAIFSAFHPLLQHSWLELLPSALRASFQQQLQWVSQGRQVEPLQWWRHGARPRLLGVHFEPAWAGLIQVRIYDVQQHQQAQQELQRQQLLDSLVSNAQTAMIGFDRRGEIRFANRSAFTLLQLQRSPGQQDKFYTPGLLCSRLLADGSEDGALPFAALFNVSTQHYDRPYRVTFPDGRSLIFTLSLVQPELRSEHAIQGFLLLTDISAQHQLQTALLEMQQHIDNLLEYSPVVVYQAFADLRKGLIYLSPNAEPWFGLSPTDAMNDANYWWQHIHPDDQERVLRGLNTMDAFAEYRLWSDSQQRYHWVKDIRQWSDTSVGVVFGAILDITARREAEQESLQLQHLLAAQKQELAQTLESLTDAVFTVDEQGLILTANPATAALFAVSHAELLQTPLSRFLPDLSLSCSSASDAPYQTSEVQGHNANGGVVPLTVSVVSLPKPTVWHGDDATYSAADASSDTSAETPHGQRFVICCHDLTALKQQQQQLLRAEKLSALGTLTSGIAHDFNNILGIIRGYAEMLSTQADQQVVGYAEHITKAADRAAGLTRSLLEFSSDRKRQVQKLELNTLLHDMKDMLSEALTKGVRLQLVPSAQPLWVELEKSGLENALLNMAINAKHAMDGRGEFSLAWHEVELNAQQAHALELSAGHYVCIQARDTGCGMTDEVKQRLFEPFFTTKGAAGNGLGLAQLFGFLRRSRGGIAVESTLGLGSTFFLYLPKIAAAAATQSSASQRSPGKTPRANARILLVDDEEELLDIHGLLLESAGYQVTLANSAAKALALAGKQAFDLVLSDIVMPDMNGLQLANELHQRLPELPIQLISGFAEQTLVDNPYCQDLYNKRLQKPVARRELLEQISKLLLS